MSKSVRNYISIRVPIEVAHRAYMVEPETFKRALYDRLAEAANGVAENWRLIVSAKDDIEHTVTLVFEETDAPVPIEDIINQLKEGEK